MAGRWEEIWSRQCVYKHLIGVEPVPMKDLMHIRNEPWSRDAVPYQTVTNLYMFTTRFHIPHTAFQVLKGTLC